MASRKSLRVSSLLRQIHSLHLESHNHHYEDSALFLFASKEPKKA